MSKWSTFLGSAPQRWSEQREPLHFALLVLVWIVPAWVKLFGCWREQDRQLSEPAQRNMILCPGGKESLLCSAEGKTHTCSAAVDVFDCRIRLSLHDTVQFCWKTPPHGKSPGNSCVHVCVQFVCMCVCVGGWDAGPHCTFLGNSCGIFNHWLHQDCLTSQFCFSFAELLMNGHLCYLSFIITNTQKCWGRQPMTHD